MSDEAQEAKETLVKYRLHRSQEVLEEASMMAQAGHWLTCINRLYYACFYAVNALLLQHDMASSKHSGVRALFSQHFVRSGIVSQDYGALYNKLFDMRQKSDYTDLYEPDPDAVQTWLPQVASFVRFISSLIYGETEEFTSTPE